MGCAVTLTAVRWCHSGTCESVYCRNDSGFFLIGYCLPDPYHQARLREVIEKFMSSLRDPSLPLLELKVGAWFWVMLIHLDSLHLACVHLKILYFSPGSYCLYIWSHSCVSGEEN